MEFFRYLIQRLAEAGVPEVRVYGGGGGTITTEEIEALARCRGRADLQPRRRSSLGLEGMIGSIVDECLEARRAAETDPAGGPARAWPASSRESRAARDGSPDPLLRGSRGESQGRRLRPCARRSQGHAPGSRRRWWDSPGTGGAGKSSVVDELVRRLRRDAPEIRIALLLVDPTRRRSGGALLGDRIRMNAIGGPEVFVRSMATRRANLSLAAAVGRRLARAAFGGLRSRLPRDGRDRPERLRDRRPGGLLALRDDARIRCALRSSRRSTCSTSPI